MFDEIAAGGMAAVHLGRLLAEAGFSRTVAIKRLHPQLARDPDFVTMFLDEARLASRIRHPNVVQTIDIVSEGEEVLLVMEYVAGESLSRLMRAAKPGRMPLAIAVAVMTAALHGLHAAHEAKTEQGVPLSLVHRDVSPQNILVGADGVARVLDFGVAKASHRAQTTREGQIKGKLAYMAPEVLRRDLFDRRTDIYAAAVVLWEAITGQKLFEADNEARLVLKVLESEVVPPSQIVPGVPPALDAVVMKGLAREPDQRWATAREMAVALERCGVHAAPSSDIGEWVESVAHASLAAKAARVVEIEKSSDQGIPTGPISSTRIQTPQAIPLTRGFAESATTLPHTAEAGSTAIVTSATLSGQEKKRRGGTLAVLGTLALVGAMGIGYSVLVKKTATTGTTAPAVELPPPPSAASSEPPSAAPPPPATSEKSEPKPEPKAEPKPEPAKSADKKPAVAWAPPAAKPKGATAAPPPAQPKSDPCKVPYTVDSSGIRHIKPECM